MATLEIDPHQGRLRDVRDRTGWIDFRSFERKHALHTHTHGQTVYVCSALTHASTYIYREATAAAAAAALSSIADDQLLCNSEIYRE